MPNEIASLSNPFHDAAMLETQEPERAWLNLSLAQQAIWLDARISAASEYQVSAWSRFTQPLQEDLFRESIRLLVARHDTLRLRVDDELPRQWLDTSEAPPLSILDLPITADPDAGFHAHVKATLSISMPLGDNPLFHVELVRARNGVSFMTWRFHQLIADSASVLLTQQLWANAYQSLVRGDSHLLLPASSCLDTLKADSSYLDSLFYDEDLAYWVTRLSPVPPRLIADMKARPVAPGAVPPAIRTLEGPPLLALQTSARAVGVPLLHTVYALFTMMLARRYGQWDVVAGMETHVPGAPGTVVLGNSSRMMPVRCQFEPTSTLADAVRAFSVQVQEDLRHRRMPIDIVARSLDMIGQGRAGLFESSMTSSPDPSTLGEVAPSDFMTRTNLLTGSVPTRAASPISLHLDDSQDQLQLCLQVNTDYLLAVEAATLATLLESVLTTFADAPQTMLDEVSTLAPEEQVYLLDAGQGRVADFPTDTLDALFTEQSLRTPSAVAIVGLDGAEVTYAELASRTTRIARRLAARGIREGEVVGVRMVRSTETILALLGILKAGAVYLPLDPGYPPDRLAFMIEDANAALVLESLDGLDTGIAPEAEIPPLSGPTRLAYLIYTSGTTGRPKGVAVAHAAPVNLAFARRAGHDPIGPGDRVLAAISVGFDVSIGQLLLPLLSGAAIVIAPDLRSISPWAFWGLLARERVTHINSVPSFLDTILDAAPEDEELSLKKLMLGGEALAGPLVRRIHQALPSVQVINMYGPTEACIDATFYLATPADYTTPVLPIGKPLANYRAYILNPRLELTGIGVTGELYLGGAGLAEGYLHLPELTTDRFIQDPFHPGERLYRTGDRARWNLQGQIEFLGRIDQQVKIRGFRVEPAEIAAVLLEQDDVAQAVVVPYAGPAGTRLTAYLVPKSPENPPQIDTVRAHAASRLPDYMVPASFQILPALPLTTNGKLDLKALPAAENTPPKFIAPRTPTEDKLAELLRSLLPNHPGGVLDHFFEAGGDSLIAIRFLYAINAQLGVSLPLQSVFELPTIAALASHIDRRPPDGI